MIIIGECRGFGCGDFCGAFALPFFRGCGSAVLDTASFFTAPLLLLASRILRCMSSVTPLPHIALFFVPSDTFGLIWPLFHLMTGMFSLTLTPFMVHLSLIAPIMLSLGTTYYTKARSSRHVEFKLCLGKFFFADVWILLAALFHTKPQSTEEDFSATTSYRLPTKFTDVNAISTSSLSIGFKLCFENTPCGYLDSTGCLISHKISVARFSSNGALLPSV